MSPLFIYRMLACASLAVLAAPALAAQPSRLLECGTELAERTVMKQAPHGARRIGKHVLEVGTAKGPQRFKELPPYDEELSGLAWQYCGYDASAQAHLIGKRDEDLFTGVVVLEADGRQVPAGHAVLFAPDHKTFVAREQPDGLDGENWTVKDIDGKVIWKGYAGMPGREQYTFISQFFEPRWTPQGRLVARYSCTFDYHIKGEATLERSLFGKWSWHPDRACPMTEKPAR